MGIIAQALRYSYLLLLLLFLAPNIAALFVEQYYGIAPCKLCIYERYVYWTGLGVCIFGVLLTCVRSNLRFAPFIVAIAILLIQICLCVYHVGIQHQLWANISSCSGNFEGSESFEEFMDATVVHTNSASCDIDMFKLFGLSLAELNLIYAFCSIIAATYLFKKCYDRKP